MITILSEHGVGLAEDASAEGDDLWFPANRDALASDSEESAEHPFARYVRRELDERGIAYLDGFKLWPELGLGAETFLPHNRHLAASGYAVVAEHLERLLRADLEHRLDKSSPSEP